MSVLKEKRTQSAAEYVNVANQIYVETVSFLTRLSAYENFDDHGRVLRLRRLFHAIFIGGANHV